MLILDVSMHWSSTHQMMHKSMYTYILVKCDLIKPITHRTCLAIWSWDQYFCYASCKSGPLRSQTLRRWVDLNQAYNWLAWEVLRCNNSDVYNSSTHAITHTRHLSWSSGLYLWGNSEFTTWAWLVYLGWTCCCSSQAWQVLLSIWPIPILYLGHVYVCIIFDHAFAYIPVVFDPRITYEGLKLDFINKPVLLADLDKSKLLLHEYYNKYYAASPAPSKDTNNICSKSFSTSDFIACYESIVPDTIDKLEEYLKIKRKHFKKCNPLRWWRS